MDPNNSIITEIRVTMARLEEKIDKVDKIIFWAGTTIVGAVILALIAVVIKKG